MNNSKIKLQVFFILNQNNEDVIFKEALKTTDLGLLLGAPLQDNPDLLLRTASFLTNKINSVSKVTVSGSSDNIYENTKSFDLNSFSDDQSRKVEILQQPSLEKFYKDYLKPQTPIKLQGTYF